MSVVQVEHPSEGVVLLRLNRPEARNALNTEMREALAQCIKEHGDHPDTRCIVITGNDKAFAAGADLKEVVNDGPIDMLQRKILQLWQVFSDCPVPIIAAVNGVALGGGCELALQADIIVVGEGVTIGQPEVRVGIMPGGGATQRLIRAIGKYRTMKLVLTGDPITGAEAAAMGLASEAVADERVLEHSLEMARTIASRPPIAVRFTKEAAMAGADASLATGLRLERHLFELLFATEDQKEGMRAFAEKRKPTYQGR